MVPREWTLKDPLILCLFILRHHEFDIFSVLVSSEILYTVAALTQIAL